VAAIASLPSSPGGEVADRFSFPMSEEGCALFSSRMSRDARVAFEATLMAYPFSKKLRERGYTDITVAHPHRADRVGRRSHPAAPRRT
jgi:hypothetical protein